MSARLGPGAAAAALQQMAQADLDVLVIGGGVVGAGVALDAVTRGLSVGLVEMSDWASGTSSRSSMLIHGGLRYLGLLDVRGVRDALHERGLLHDRIAPHLVQRVPFLYPLAKSWQRGYVGTGLLLYDTLAQLPEEYRLPPHRHLTKRSVHRIAPGLKMDEVTGAVQFYDAQVDDARYVVTVVRTAAHYGALVANRARATQMITDRGRVIGARVCEVGHGREHEIRARVVIRATGVWTEPLNAPAPSPGLAAAGHTRKGVHLVVPRGAIKLSTGVVQKREQGMVLIIPWGRHWIIGTTDTPWQGDPHHPAPTEDDVDALLSRVNLILDRPLTRSDIESTYAGLRLMAEGESNRLWELPAKHAAQTQVPGLVVATGGTYTTYRILAEAAVNAAAASIGGLIADSVTHRLSLLGADGYHARWNQRHLLARQAGLHVARVEHLLKRYGSLADELLALIRRRPDLRAPLPGAEDYLAVEAVYAVTHEGASELEDIIERRMRIAIETPSRGVSAVAGIAALVASELGWNEQEKNAQISRYLRIAWALDPVGG